MAKNVASSFAQLESMIMAAVEDTLDKEVAKTVKDEMQKSVKSVIYDSGKPVEYIRRDFEDGSLGDINEMKHNVKSGELTVTNNADFNHGFAQGKYGGVDLNKSLTYNMVYGYDTRLRWYNKPRDFMGKTRVNIVNSKSHLIAMKSGLQDRLGKGSVV